MMKKKLPIVLACMALLGLASPLSACQEDLGPAHNRVADWDASPPGVDSSGTINSNNMLTDWLPECGLDGFYPCPPYEAREDHVFPNKFFASGNLEADEWANADGIFSLADYYQSDSTLLFIFYGALG